MKKTLLSLALGLATTVVFGQIEAGTKILGGTFNYQSESEKLESGGQSADGPKSSNLSLIPSFGYMFQDNIGAGLRVGINQYNWSQDVGGQTIEQKMNMTVVGLFGRYYIDVAGDNLYFHTDLVLDFGFGKNEDTDIDINGDLVTTSTDINTTSIGLRPGWDYFIGDKWAVEMNWGFLGYASRKEDYGNDNTSTTSGFQINFDFSQFGLGARWYF